MRRVSIVLMLMALTLTAGAQSPKRALLPTMAGAWYPEDPQALRTAVTQCCAAQNPAPAPPGRIFAMVVPHAPLQTSGSIAGAAFRLINPDDYDRVFVLYPSHYSSFNSCSLPGVQYARTPLGDIPFDVKLMRTLDMSALFEICSISYSSRTVNKYKIHEYEYSLQAVLPFLQTRLQKFTLVPIAVGTYLTEDERPEVHALAATATLLKKHLTKRTLIVISTDFTHYGDKFKYTPFPEDTLKNIEQLDRIAFDLVLKRDFEGFLDYVTQTENVICGRNALAILIKLLPATAQGTLLQYEISGAKTGSTNPSISFASLVFTCPNEGD